MTITIHSGYIDAVATILLNDLRLCSGSQMNFTGMFEMQIVQETDELYPQFAGWLGDAAGCGLISAMKIERI